MISFLQQSKQSQMATQKQIDDLLKDSWCGSSSLNQNTQLDGKPGKRQFEESKDQYGGDDFQDYDQSKRTNNIGYSQSDISMSRQPKKKQELRQIIEKPLQENRKQKLKISQNTGSKRQTKIPKHGLANVQKLHLAHNYARLQQRQRELLMTSLSQENKQLKNQLHHKNRQVEKQQNKYKVLLNQKTQNISTAKEQALEKKITVLQGKLERVINLNKIEAEKNKYKTKISNAPHNFIPEEEAERRQSQLLQIIQKLKERLIQSDQNLLIVKRKMKQDAEHNDQLLCKMRRVQQLDYRLDKMVQQAEADRGLIQALKQKTKDTENKLAKQKDRRMHLEATIRRLQMSQQTSSDLLQQLLEAKRQKQLLEKSLKQLSSNMLSNIKNARESKPNSYIINNLDIA